MWHTWNKGKNVFETYYLLCFRDEFVSVIPVSQEIRCLFIIYPNVMIFEDAWEEVIYLSSDIQNIPHPAKKPREKLALLLRLNPISSTAFLIYNFFTPYAEIKYQNIEES